MTTQPATAAVITPRTRALGYGWSHTPIAVRPRPGLEHYAIPAPTAPTVIGSLRDVEVERERAARINSTADWVERLFVGDQPVTAARIVQEAHPVPGYAGALPHSPYFEVMRRGRPAVGAIVAALRAGAHVELTTGAAE
jgi:hypothetical protein